MKERTKADRQKTAPHKTQHKDQSDGPPVVTIDFEYYEKYLSDYDISDDQKRELIAALASIMMGFVDLGFGIAPGQIACKDGKKTRDKTGDFSSKNPGNPLYLEQYSTNIIDPNAAFFAAAKERDS